MMNGSMLFSFTFLLIFLCYSTTGVFFNFTSTASLSTTWTTDASGPSNLYLYGSNVRLSRQVLYRGFGKTLLVACGFICNEVCTSYRFAIVFLLIVDDMNRQMVSSDVIWSANRDQPVREGATLNLTTAGDLVLQDENGRKVWSSNTSGKSVVGMNLTDTGNLVLFDVHGKVVWQSFDHPTDCLVPGQKLFQGQKLIPSVSSTNWTAQKGMFSLELADEGLFAYVGSNPQQVYYSNFFNASETSEERNYIRFLNGNLSFILSAKPSVPRVLFRTTNSSSIQYMKLMPNGHLQVFGFQDGWTVVADLLNVDVGECGYPLACGRNGLCSNNHQCVCPESLSPGKQYFKPVNDRHPDMGCSEITPLTCNSTQHQDFMELKNVDYFTFKTIMVKTNFEACKNACIKSCSCKAAILRYGRDPSDGYCYLLSEIFTMKIIDPDVTQYNVFTFLKVHKIRSSSSSGKIVGSTIGTILFLLVAIIGCIILVVHKRNTDTEMEEDYIDQVPGMPTRFSYEELKAATDDFCRKLGQGGFGSVFEGTLEDGSKIAVKRLEGLVQTQKSFLAELESIGNIHHVNLVRLRGFCSLKTKLLLVYEFMSNGSLDRWIYHRDQEHVLNWECRKKIIVDIAKGLAYLHEECRQRILHLDIKPQNILLDDDFNAKIADFGMAKLVEKNQAQVMTNMRGTPGYMAPEWLSSIITEKVDVYSFGIVLLEILCGRKNFDRSEPEESWHLLGVFQKAWEQGKLLGMIDKYNDDMQAHAMEVVEMMKLVSWCLQCDFTRRPSMTWVIKVLEGVMEVEMNLDYNFTDPRLHKTTVERETGLTQMFPSFLSGPRETSKRQLIIVCRPRK